MVRIPTPICAMCFSGYHSHLPIASKNYCLTAGNPSTLYGCTDHALHGGGVRRTDTERRLQIRNVVPRDLTSVE